MVRRCRRRSVQYASFCDGFLIRGKDIEAECFHRQYFHFYRARVKLLQQRILTNAKQLLGMSQMGVCHNRIPFTRSSKRFFHC
ncbi:unnamed protein product [Gongylonema pulchrum]|uniref:Uncharacterized protein n=1 Tax=Gongylonema pulchrum TaxID=637853 RepID=A0A183F123_9BILA|nr:unnamed protein product [Gongylonema pulchrum]